MSCEYIEKFAKTHGITEEEAMEYGVVKEYLKYHPLTENKKSTPSKETTVLGCSSSVLKDF